MSHDAKRKALIFLVLALIMTLVIGAGLPRLRFQPGLPLPNVQFGQLVVPPSANSQPVGMPVSALFIVLLLTCLTGFLFFGIYRLLRGSHWKEVLSSFVYFLLVLLVTFGLLFLAVRLLPSSPGLAAASLPGPKPFEYSSVGPVPPILIWLAGLGLLAALISLVVAIIRSRSLPVAGPWALEAEKARLAILAGDNLKDVIVRCYQRMSQALLQEQSLVREPFMTTGDFERLLAAQGVPRDPVHQLTQLFEAVRYGHWQPDAGDEQRALHSLDAILAYSRSTKQAN